MHRSSESSEFSSEEPQGLIARPASSQRDRLRALALQHGAAIACDGARQIVPGEGNASAQVVLVGEAPGEEEDRLGRPFVGRSGKLLEQLLHTAGLDRRDLWITNTVKCRPVEWQGDRARNRAPKASEVKAWLPCLHEELALLRPRLIVGLGAVAGRALIAPDFKITARRGQWFASERFNAQVLITWHPSYLLRQVGPDYHAHMAEAVADFQSVYQRLQGGF